MKTKLPIATFLLSLLPLPFQIAQAGGFASARFGSEWGHVTADHPTAIYYNPAGLALGDGTRIFTEGVLAYRSASYHRPVAAIDNVTDSGIGTPSNDVAANSGKANLSNILASPFLGVVTDFGVENLAVGTALFAPFGGQANWDKNSAYKGSEKFPGAVDGAQRWSTIEGTIRAVYISLAAAYQLPKPRLSFGASLNVVRQNVDTLRARNATGSDDLVVADGGVLEGRSYLDVSGTHVALGIGTIWQPTHNSWIGLSYQSQPGFGETKQSGTLSNKFGTAPLDDVPVDLVQTLPDIIRLGGRLRPISKVELRLAADITRWSVFTDQCLIDSSDPDANCDLDENGGGTAKTTGTIVNVHRGWNNTFAIQAGGSYWLKQELELVGGLKFDSNAVPDKSMDPSLMDMNKVSTTLGGRWRLNSNFRLSATYTHVFYASRTVDIRDAPPAAPSRLPDHAGTYSQTIGLLNLGVEALF